MYKFLITFLLVLMTACSTSPQNVEVKKTAVPVHVVEVVEIDLPRYIETIGSLKPVTFIEIRPQVSGILAEVNFTEGQLVSKGHQLFAIDSSPYKIRLLEANAQKERDAAVLSAARKKMDRFQGLAKKDLISQQEWDELILEVAKHAAQLQADEAKVAAAALDFKNCSIASPIAGKTGRVGFHAGSLVTSFQPASLVAIACIDCLTVEFNVTEQQFLQLGQMGVLSKNADGIIKLPIEVSSMRAKGHSSNGFLTFSDYEFDIRSGLLMMRGEIENDQNYFLPGQSVKVKLPIEMARNVILVPEKAIKINQQGPYVYRINEGNQAELCQICQGEVFGNDVSILEGVQKGDLIVTEGHLRLYPGVAVEPIIFGRDLR
ncbi:MAG: efflux RND transporter periplasmic adaptor subunit [Parachlamydiaceae bacterium]|nr:efflux RND transporter periplasmic adaptor subunit [Parachlamydiaceae bacterium]